MSSFRSGFVSLVGRPNVGKSTLVNQLVGTKVTITVARKTWDRPKVMTLTRATISIESVQAKLLAGNIGYVRLKNFQGNTTHDLQAAIRNLAKQADDFLRVKSDDDSGFFPRLESAAQNRTDLYHAFLLSLPRPFNKP